MKKLQKNYVSNWSTNRDPKKYEFLRTVLRKENPGDVMEEIVSFLSSADAYKFSDHFYRYAITLLEMKEYRNLVGARILETGGASPVLDYFAKRNECFHTESDLRIEIDAPDEYFDVCLSLEVIEHVKDRPERDFSEVVLFQSSGAISLAREVFRVLRPGGVLILTTPNPASTWALKKLLNQEPPMVFRPHVREYTKHELIDMFSMFELRAYKSMFSFFLMGLPETEKVKEFSQLGADLRDRGDDHFFVFRKPG